MIEVICSCETVFLQEAHGVASQKTAFFIVTTVKTANLASTQHFISKQNYVNVLMMVLFPAPHILIGSSSGGYNKYITIITELLN
jgi:hypothetical protein